MDFKQRFELADETQLASENPLAPVQGALVFILEPETWPVFRAWLNATTGDSGYSETSDRRDMERALEWIINLGRTFR